MSKPHGLPIAPRQYEDIEAEYRGLIKRLESCTEDKMKVGAELASRKRQLKEAMDEVKEAGFDPDNLQDEIKKAKEILITKMQVISADLDTAESVLQPMVHSIESNG